MDELKGRSNVTQRAATTAENRRQGKGAAPRRVRNYGGQSEPTVDDSYQPRNSGGSLPNPGSASVGVGGLEAEFIAAIVLLVILMFADTTSSYTDKVMSFIKRGTLSCILFFILALISSTGPNAAKICKGIGALVIVAILVTSPVNTAIGDVDKIIKNDWVGQPSSTSTNTSGSADTGTAGATSTPGILGDLEGAVKEATDPLSEIQNLSGALSKLKGLF